MKAKRVSKPGSTPVYEYAGYRIVNVSGTAWKRGWLYRFEGRDHYSSTLGGAKWHIDYMTNQRTN